jgi:aspartate aminotransferase-like enzyme
MPDRFVSGTLNLAGIYGLHAALSELLEQGVPARRERELTLLERFTAAARMEGFRTIGQATSRAAWESSPATLQSGTTRLSPTGFQAITGFSRAAGCTARRTRTRPTERFRKARCGFR